MKIAYFDCFAGVSGDMTLGALVDLGVEPARLEDAIRSAGIDGFALEVRSVRKHGIGAVKVDVRATDHQHERHLGDIERLLDAGGLDPALRERARAVFRRLAEAESRVHRVPLERVHLHEVGGLDAIADVVGAVAGLDALGVERVVCSPVVTGRGLGHGEHGAIPIPGPATLELLAGRPIREGPVEAEMTTPTGAALVSTLAESFGPMPPLRVLRSGYGAGTRDFDAVPNLLRIVLGETAGDGAAGEDFAVLLEANLDDLSPQVIAFVQSLVLERGALDVWTTPIVMKKGRAGHLLSVLVRPGDAEAMASLLFTETTTLGVRFVELGRRVLERRFEEVETPWGKVRVKVACEGSRVVNAQPEFDDCAAIAARAGVALKDVQAAAAAAWRGRG